MSDAIPFWVVQVERDNTLIRENALADPLGRLPLGEATAEEALLGHIRVTRSSAFGERALATLVDALIESDITGTTPLTIAVRSLIDGSSHTIVLFAGELRTQIEMRAIPVVETLRAALDSRRLPDARVEVSGHGLFASVLHRMLVANGLHATRRDEDTAR